MCHAKLEGLLTKRSAARQTSPPVCPKNVHHRYTSPSRHNPRILPPNTSPHPPHHKPPISPTAILPIHDPLTQPTASRLTNTVSPCPIPPQRTLCNEDSLPTRRYRPNPQPAIPRPEQAQHASAPPAQAVEMQPHDETPRRPRVLGARDDGVAVVRVQFVGGVDVEAGMEGWDGEDGVLGR